jgi:pyruvate/2-oxoglutarate dehydrogenase complex dihydrolipoamide acyltransferase (E2) component
MTDRNTSEELAALESQIEAFGAGDDDLDLSPEQSETAVEAAAPETPQSQAQIATLDAILDDPTLPENWRGKKLRELYEDRLNMTHQAHRAGQEKNELMARVQVAETALEMLRQQQMAHAQQQPAQPKPSVFERAGVNADTDIVMRPGEFVTKTLNVFGNDIKEEVTGQVQQVVAPLQAELQSLRSAQYRQMGEQLFSKGFELANARSNGRKYQRETWDKLAQPLVTYMTAQQLDPRDPSNFVRAAEYFESLFPAPAPQAPPAAQPQIANPPVGGSKPASVGNASQSKPSISKVAHEEARRIAKEMGVSEDVLIAQLAANPQTEKLFGR